MKEKELHRGVVPFLNCKDYLVSNETYEVMLNKQIEMLVTSPIPSDLSKYYDSEEYVSHHNTKKTLLNFIYNTVKKYSFKKKQNLFNDHQKNKTVLDIGTGTGDFLFYCKQKGFLVTGIEPSDIARQQAIEKKVEVHKDLKDVLGKDAGKIMEMAEPKWPVYKRIMEKVSADKAKKDAEKGEEMDSKDSEGAKKFVDDHEKNDEKKQGDKADIAVAIKKNAAAMANPMKAAPLRPGDNKAGDKVADKPEGKM